MQIEYGDYTLDVEFEVDDEHNIMITEMIDIEKGDHIELTPQEEASVMSLVCDQHFNDVANEE